MHVHACRHICMCVCSCVYITVYVCMSALNIVCVRVRAYVCVFVHMCRGACAYKFKKHLGLYVDVEKLYRPRPNFTV